MSTIVTATEVTGALQRPGVLDAATLAIDEGQRIGLVGRNGLRQNHVLAIACGAAIARQWLDHAPPRIVGQLSFAGFHARPGTRCAW